MMFCSYITRFIVWLILMGLRKLVKNTWAVLYIRNIRLRIYMLILSILWFIAMNIIATRYEQLIGEEYAEDEFENIHKLVQCIFISSLVFLASHIIIVYVALNSYFITFREQARKLKAYVAMMKIMLNLAPNEEVFNLPIMPFLIDFPSHNQEGTMNKKEQKKMVEFRFNAFDIDIDESEMKLIIHEQIESKSAQTKMMNLIPSIIEEEDILMDEPEEYKTMRELLESDLYSVNLSQGRNSAKIIKKETLRRLSMLISYLIQMRLNTQKDKILKSNLYINSKTVTNIEGNFAEERKRRQKERVRTLSMEKQSKSHRRSRSLGYTSSGRSDTGFGLPSTFRGFSAFGSKQKSKDDKYGMVEAKMLNVINEDIFTKCFKRYQQQYELNEEILEKLGQLAWRKFADHDKDFDKGETPEISKAVLNINIQSILNDLLRLKQSIDSYIVIIRNLQQMVDVITPILLLFVYLYIFNFDFQQTLTLYVSSVGIIGFFGSSYFSSVFASVSFIIVFDPFLVGDEILWKGDDYRVREISLISCTFKQFRTGHLYAFQNKQLGASKDPIINRSRSGMMKYRYTLYFQSGTKNQILYQFVKECCLKLKDVRDEELAFLENRKKRDYTHENKTPWHGYCTFSELKNLKWNQIIFKSCQLDEYGRKKVFIEAKYDAYSWNVRTMTFNVIMEVANSDEFKQYLADTLPISMDQYNEIDRNP